MFNMFSILNFPSRYSFSALNWLNSALLTVRYFKNQSDSDSMFKIATNSSFETRIKSRSFKNLDRVLTVSDFDSSFLNE